MVKRFFSNKRWITMISLSFIICHLSFSEAQAQTATEVLDKCAATLDTKNGIKANFTMESPSFGTTSGEIVVRGRQFHAQIPVASMWFDGKTQWTYMKKNDEVNISTPSESQQQAFNPYNFITLYKKGYKSTMTRGNNTFDVHLTASDASKKIQEMFISVDSKTYAPVTVKMLQGKKWTTFRISNLKKAQFTDADFRFNPKDYPTAEVIDLR